MTDKYYQMKKKISGVEYTAQFNGLSVALAALDQSYIDNSSNISIAKMANYVLEHIIIEPANLTPDDFDDLDVMNEVVRFGREVMQGRFREKKNPRTTEKTSKG